MDVRELEAQAKALAPVIAAAAARACGALKADFERELAARDQRIAAMAEQHAALAKALDGHVAVKAADVLALLDLGALAQQAAALVPAPADGKSVGVDDVRDLLLTAVREAVAALPPAPAGKDADMEMLKAHVEQLVGGIAPAAAPTAEEVAATFERRFSDLVLSWERQARDTFDKAAERMPVPKDGRDALQLEHFELALADDGRTVTLSLRAGDVVVEKALRLPTIIDRGVFGHDKAYDQGDGVTYGGCFWIAQKDSPEGVPGGGPDWRLAVKKGRDGRDLRESASTHDQGKGVKV